MSAGQGERRRGSAIIGASRPEQIDENVQAAAVVLDASVLQAMEEAVGALAER